MQYAPLVYGGIFRKGKLAISRTVKMYFSSFLSKPIIFYFIF